MYVLVSRYCGLYRGCCTVTHDAAGPSLPFPLFWVGEMRVLLAFAERGFEGRGLYVCQCNSWQQRSTLECASLANPPRQVSPGLNFLIF